MKIEKIRTGWFKQKWSFRVRADNGKIIIPPEHYFNHGDMVDTIISLQKELPTAEIVNIDRNKNPKHYGKFCIHREEV